MLNNHVIPEERPAETLGSRFRNARISLGKSLPEAAQVTCINPTTLANLEADNFTKMPAEVFTRGFIKLYAQYLGLDANEAIKLYIDQENLDPERPVEQPFRRDIPTGTAAMAHPFRLFKGSPRVRIIAILLTVLVAFYVLGAIFKVVQKHSDQVTQENELANSLVDSNTPPPPAAPGEPLPATEIEGQTGVSTTTPLTSTTPEGQTGVSTTTPLTSTTPEGQTGDGSTDSPAAIPFQPLSIGAVPAGQPATGTAQAPPQPHRQRSRRQPTAPSPGDEQGGGVG